MYSHLKVVLATLFTAIVLVGCAKTGSIEMLSEARTPIDAKQVQVMQNAPENGQAIANIRASFSYGVRQTLEEKQLYAAERARAQAGKLGANVIVIHRIENQSTSAGAVTAGVFDGQTNGAIESQPTPVVYATAYYVD